jgi:hypothetical protein
LIPSVIGDGEPEPLVVAVGAQVVLESHDRMDQEAVMRRSVTALSMDSQHGDLAAGVRILHGDIDMQG